MIITHNQIQEMRSASQPLMDWLSNNCHPHVKAIVENQRVEILEGLALEHSDAEPKGLTADETEALLSIQKEALDTKDLIKRTIKFLDDDQPWTASAWFILEMLTIKLPLPENCPYRHNITFEQNQIVVNMYYDGRWWHRRYDSSGPVSETLPRPS